jgi:E3 ubiquitin-protein ligase SHPRH
MGKGMNAAHEFQTNPRIKVLLLHGERENAGLSITSACRVFLLEPTVNHNFELQGKYQCVWFVQDRRLTAVTAIARVDRLGQERQTEVYCYATESTVEKNILDLGARKGLSLFTKDSADTTLDIMKYSEQDKQHVDGAKKLQKQKGDFVAKVDDMLACIFPHLYDGFADEEDETVRGIGAEVVLFPEGGGSHTVDLDSDTDMVDASQVAGSSGWNWNPDAMDGPSNI